MPYCGECKQECTPVAEDQGVGSYECHGYRGVHHDWCLVSDCCDAEVYLDEECTRLYDYSEWKYDGECDRADYLYDCSKDEGLIYDREDVKELWEK